MRLPAALLTSLAASSNPPLLPGPPLRPLLYRPRDGGREPGPRPPEGEGKCLTPGEGALRGGVALPRPESVSR